MRIVEVFNPLPAALHHYEVAVVSVLQPPVKRGGSASIERSSGSGLRRLARQLFARLSHLTGRGPLLVLWPAFGLWDPLSWRLVAVRRPVYVVMHDPEPLRRQYGYGARARRLAARLAGSRVVVIAHSEPAAEVLRKEGWRPLLLSMPLAPSTALDERGKHVVVLGQYKPSRDLGVLEQLATCKAADGLRRVRGRGWPELPGWDVDEGFLTEEEFQRELSGAACVVIPYRHYFQSDVAVRALEAGVPVVADRHPFLEQLLGPDWPGYVGDGDWCSAVERAQQVLASDLVARASSSRERARSEWRSALTAGTPGTITR